MTDASSCKSLTPLVSSDTASTHLSRHVHRYRLDESDHNGTPAYSLLYMFFWPWNAPYEPLSGHSFGAHVADLEHVRLILDQSSLRIIEVCPRAI